MKTVLAHLATLLFFLASCAQGHKKQFIKEEEGIQFGSFADAGIDSVAVNSIDNAIRNGTYPNLHSLLIARNNKLVYEKYWPGMDEVWGDNRAIVIHGRDSLHDIRSISKSIVSACVGIVLQQGKIKSVNQKVFDFFPEYAKLDTGLKALLTIGHLLTMSSGLVWNEDVPYDNPENSEIRMIRSSDPVQYVLSQPMNFPPGNVWKYNGGTTQLLAAIIEKTTGKKVDEFAREYLFQPLGITRFEWARYPGTSMPAAASGLRLRSRDLLKFALLYYNHGTWHNNQIVPEKWIEESFQRHIQRPGGGWYGYQFWLGEDTIGNKSISMIACVGNGDQRIFLDRTNDLIVIVTAGNYNKWDIKKNSSALLKEKIYPAIKN